MLDICFIVSEIDGGGIGFFVFEFDVLGISKGIEFVIVFVFSLVSKYYVEVFLIT